MSFESFRPEYFIILLAVVCIVGLIIAANRSVRSNDDET